MKKLLLLVVLAFTIVSCSDKDEPETGTPFERLTASGEKKWRLVGAQGFGDGGLEINLFVTQGGCLDGNELTLRTDNTYTFEDTGVVCKTDDGRTVERVDAKWVFSESPLQIKLDEISMLGRSIKDVVIDVKDMKNASFTAVIEDLPQDNRYTMGLERIVMKFEASK